MQWARYFFELWVQLPGLSQAAGHGEHEPGLRALSTMAGRERFWGSMGEVGGGHVCTDSPPSSAGAQGPGLRGLEEPPAQGPKVISQAWPVFWQQVGHRLTPEPWWPSIVAPCGMRAIFRGGGRVLIPPGLGCAHPEP